MNEFRMVFTKRKRYVKACQFLMSSKKYELLHRGRIADSKFYVEFKTR
nr:MAG TPA: hypothetical protein [Bacteriophage sp.]